MKSRMILLAAALALSTPAFSQLKGQLQLPEFASLADKATESVTVTLDSTLLGMGCRFLNAEDPQEADAKKLCTGLSGIYVRSFTFDSDFAYPKADVEGVRRQLSSPGWSRIVGAVSKKEQTNVDVFVLVDNGKARGLGIIAIEPRQFTIVNIVGNVDLEQLHNLEGKLGVPNLEIETTPKKAPEPKVAPKVEPKSAPKPAPKKT
jgi:hypothetical protein